MLNVQYFGEAAQSPSYVRENVVDQDFSFISDNKMNNRTNLFGDVLKKSDNVLSNIFKELNNESKSCNKKLFKMPKKKSIKIEKDSSFITGLKIIIGNHFGDF